MGGRCLKELGPGLCYSSGFSFGSALSLCGAESPGQEDWAWCSALAESCCSVLPQLPKHPRLMLKMQLLNTVGGYRGSWLKETSRKSFWCPPGLVKIRWEGWPLPPSSWSCTFVGQGLAKRGLMRFVSGAWWKKDGERRHEQEWGDFLHRGEMSLGAEQLPEVAQHLCHRRATSGPAWVVSPGDAASIHTYLSL